MDSTMRVPSRISSIRRMKAIQRQKRAKVQSSCTPSLRIPSRFVDFCKWLGRPLTPGQRAFARVAYDGEAIGDDPIAQKIFGGNVEIPALARKTIAAVIGARGGKSYALVSLRMVWGVFVRDLSMLAPGEVAISLVVAPTLKHSKQVINYIRGALESKPELAQLMLELGGDRLAVPIRLPGGKLVTFESFAAGSKGSGVRGRTLVDAVLDESAFFSDQGDGYEVNDVDTYTAAIARVVPGGQVILPSTPWAESGLLWDTYEENYGHPKTALVGQATTLDLNDVQWTRDLVSVEEQRDPENARREYHAQFMTAGVGTYFDGNAIKDATKVYALGAERDRRFHYAAAADFAFKSDSSARVIVQWDGVKYREVYELEIKPEHDKALKPSEVVKQFADVVKLYGLSHIIADGHYAEAIREQLLESKINLLEAPAGITGKLDTHARAKACLHEGKCEFPEDAKLPDQLKQVLKSPLPGGGLRIYVKRKPGRGHGDIASAWVLAVNHLALLQVAPAETPEPEFGTLAWDAWKFKKDEVLMLKREKKRHGKEANRIKW